MSRRYGGIHFAQGDLTGRALRRLVGAKAWAKKAQTYFDGTVLYRSPPIPAPDARPAPRTLTRE